MNTEKTRIGIYIHLPFCASKCAYCDFNSKAGMDKLIPQYQQALMTHIREMEKVLSGFYIDTVYFGGGTPSYYGSKRLTELFSALKTHANVLVDSEVTFEANPDSVEPVMLQELKKAGFNRISLGVQSANDKMLKTLGRRHTFAQAEKAVSLAREAGFENLSLDLMYGLPSQSKTDWAETLKKALSLKPEHMSCYALHLEEGTPLYSFKDTPFMPDDDAQADMYLYAVEQLKQFGYKQYEISNFCLPGYESRHNLRYWQCGQYIGFGAGAHSYFGSLRYSCISDISQYIDAVSSGNAFIDMKEEITSFGKASEYLMLGLRTTHGISGEEYVSTFKYSFDDIEHYLQKCRDHGWAAKSDGRWCFTPEGFLISNTLICDILELQQKELTKMNRFLHRDSSRFDEQLTMFPSAGQDITLFPGM
ncbi:MAG: radical SAM family heme chaperone HemW [Oscillospiraceae bacterium]|nr:radical SAM family heme chaperone HemW [Oscillospiraceae bacterium]